MKLSKSLKAKVSIKSLRESESIHKKLLKAKVLLVFRVLLFRVFSSKGRNSKTESVGAFGGGGFFSAMGVEVSIKTLSPA